MTTSYYKGRVALVTGASAGIGAAITEALVKEGLIVIGASRNVRRIEEAAETLKSESGRLIPKKLDVCKDEEVVELYKWAETELGGIDVVINNAGVVHLGPFQELTTEQIKNVLDTNLFGVAISAREALKSMIKRNLQDGYIININSVLGHSAIDFRGLGYGVYPASKFGVTALTKTLRISLNDAGLKSRITSINPGMTKSDLTADAIEKHGITAYINASDVATAVSFVLNLPLHVEIPDLTIVPTGTAR